MNIQKINEILKETAYIRTGGSKEELHCAKYLCQACEELGLTAQIEPFEVPLYSITEARLTVNGETYPCKGYFNAGNGTVKAPLYYFTHNDAVSLKQCKGKIVLIDGVPGYWTYRDLLAHGAVGFIGYNGNLYYSDRDIDQKELRHVTNDAERIPGVMIHAEDAVKIVEQGEAMAEITLQQTATTGQSHNVIVDLPGETEEMVIFSAHYDSTALSTGAYDNMSSSIGLLHIAEYFARTPHHYGIRLLWCGSEERGLLGSKAYCTEHQEELSKLLLNINLDMLGCTMGKFTAFSTATEKAKHYMECIADELGFSMESKYGIRSSDSNSFADCGVPALSFARYAPSSIAPIHNRYDTAKVMSPRQLLADMEFITEFTRRLVTAKQFPLPREVSDKIKEDLDYYFLRKRR